MSKSASTTVQRNPSTSQLPSRSAWSRGPPQVSAVAAVASPGVNTPRSNSPAINSQPQQQQQQQPQQQQQRSNQSQQPIPSNVNHPAPSHSRRPSALSGAGGIAVGVSTSVPRSIPTKTTSSPVTFGSFDDPATQISGSPGTSSYVGSKLANSSTSDTAPRIAKFGSIQADSAPQSPAVQTSNINGRLNPPAVNAPPSTSKAPNSMSATSAPVTTSTPTTMKQAAPTPASSSSNSAPKQKWDPKKLFQSGGATTPAASGSSYVPAQNRLESASPAPPPTSIPIQQPPGPVPRSGYPYSPQIAPRSLAPGGQPPRSPNFSRAVPNGRPTGAASNGTASSLPPQPPHSPRMGMQPIPIVNGPAPQVVPQPNNVVAAPGVGVPAPMSPPPGAMGSATSQPSQMVHPGMWPQYYYTPYPMTEQPYMGQPPYGGPWLPHPPPHTPHLPPHQISHPPHQPGQPPSHLPPSHASHSPHLAHQIPPSPQVVPPPLTSPPPASPNISMASPVPGHTSASALSSLAPAFNPRRTAAVVIKDQAGKELSFHRRDGSLSLSKGAPIRMETEEGKKARLEAERKKEEAERKKREEAEAEELRKKKEEEERIRKAEEERIRKEEEEKERIRKEKEEQERLKREEEERERKRKEDEEKERIRKEEEEKERLRREEEERERLRKEEEERLRKLKEEEEERQRKLKEEEVARKRAEEERIRKEKEEEERIQREKEEEAKRLAEEARKREEDAERLRLQKEEDEKKAAAAAAAAASSAADNLLSEEPDNVPELGSTPSPVPSPAPTLPIQKRRPIPGPLDLTSAGHVSGASIPQPLPSALATARRLNSLDEVRYPDNILSPRPELNQGAQQGKFKYDRDFLLQFMLICKEKPDNLTLNDVISQPGAENPLTPHPMDRTSSGRRGRVGSQPMAPPPTIPNRGAVGLGIPFNQKPGNFSMGQFGTTNRHVTGPVGAVPFPGGKTPLTRTASQGGASSLPNQPSGLGSNRHRGSRQGKHRTAENRVQSQHGTPLSGAVQLPSAEPVVPLEISANRWVANSLPAGGFARRPQAADETSPEFVDRKVKSLLNKLTMEKFDSISDQVIEWANKSEKEADGRTLMRVIRLVFEKATDEATWSEMYARLCRKMHEKISTNVVDEGIKTQEGKPFAGGQLFRKYLLNRCQEDFERGWQLKEVAAAAAANKAADDVKAAAAATQGEEVLYSDEYYILQKAKRQGLGLVKFIGELFKLQMLTERIMHECIKKLLSNVDNPAEEEIESLCKLLTTIGQQLDTQKASKHMDVYFTRMKELSSSPKISSRMQYMLMGVIELRANQWRARNQIAAPTTIAAVHEQAAKEKAAAEREVFSGRAMPMSRGGSRRGEHSREFSQTIGPDGWTTTGPPPAASRAPAKAGDLSQFGKINKVSQSQMGPSAVFKKDSKPRDAPSLSRSSSSANMFSMLNTEGAQVEPAPSRGSQPPSRKPSGDFTQSGIPGITRKKLQLLPRSIPVAAEEGASPVTPDKSSDSESEPEEGEIREGDEAERQMSRDEAERKVKEDVKELFAVRDLDEAEEYFKGLPSEHHPYLIDRILQQVLEKKEADAKFVASLFQRAAEKQLCDAGHFEEGLEETMIGLDDISVDVPAAFKLMAIVVKGTQLSSEVVERLSDKIMVDGEPMVPPKKKFLTEIEKLA